MHTGSTPPPKYELRWRADRVAYYLGRRKIADRSDLAQFASIARATAYDAFRPDWSGRATAKVLAQLAGSLDVKPDSLVEVAVVQ